MDDEKVQQTYDSSAIQVSAQNTLTSLNNLQEQFDVLVKEVSQFKVAK